ncbi:MAG TPA: SelT/SelW/SelH family protein [Desulfobulbus sp.]|nr:SelT/SelW/SelH family protein [Desulfobulbus sp.]
MEEELRGALGADADVELIAGSSGVYEVVVDGRQIFSKKQSGRFPEDGEVLGLINK